MCQYIIVQRKNNEGSQLLSKKCTAATINLIYILQATYVFPYYFAIFKVVKVMVCFLNIK